MDEILDREEERLDKRVRQVTGNGKANPALLSACLDLYRLATARIGYAEPGELTSLCPDQYGRAERAAEQAGLEAPADFLQSIGLADAARLRPLEPDLLGEYFVLRWLLAERNADKRLDFLRRVWKHADDAFIFFARLSSDHGHLLNERPEHWLRLLPPPEDLELQEDVASALWYAMLTVNAIAECSHAETCRKLADRLEALHGAYPGNAEIALTFAKGLVNLSNKQDAAEAAGTVERLADLHGAYPGHAEIALTFAKGLFNLSLQYLLVQAPQKAAATLARLSALHRQHHDNDGIAQEIRELTELMKRYTLLP